MYLKGLFPHPNVSEFHLLSYLTSPLFPFTNTLEGLLEQRFLEDNSYALFCETENFIIIFMALNIVLENYFEDVLSLVDQSSDICDEILNCWFLLFNIFHGLFKLNRFFLLLLLLFFAYDFGALHILYHTVYYMHSRDVILSIECVDDLFQGFISIYI